MIATQKTEQQVLSEPQSTLQGLSESEANKRIRQFGENSFDKLNWKNRLLEFLATFRSPLVIILLFVAFLLILVGEAIDAMIVLIIVLMSVILNFIQEYSADKAAEKLREKLISTVTLLCDNQKKELAVKRLCLRDILMLSAGDLVPADGRVLEARDFL